MTSLHKALETTVIKSPHKVASPPLKIRLVLIPAKPDRSAERGKYFVVAKTEIKSSTPAVSVKLLSWSSHDSSGGAGCQREAGQEALLSGREPGAQKSLPEPDGD